MVDFSRLGQQETNSDQPTVFQGNHATPVNSPERIPQTTPDGDDIAENPYIASLKKMSEQNRPPVFPNTTRTPENCTPMLSIWFHPRRTAHVILDDSSYLWVPILAGISGITSMMVDYFNNGAGRETLLAEMVKNSLIAGTIVAVLWMYFSAFLFRITSWILGGQTGYLGITRVMAWSSVPAIFVGALIFGLLPVFGPDLMSGVGAHPDNQPLTMVQYTLQISTLIASIWAFVLFWGAFSEVQGFSFLRTLSCLLLTGLLFILLIFLLFQILMSAIISLGGMASLP